MKRLLLAAGLLLLPAVALADSLDKYIELLRADIRTAKTELLTEALKMTDEQGAKFWPIQREYETELAKVQDRRIAMIKDYAQNFDNMTDKKATELVTLALKLEDERNALVKKYAARVQKTVSATVAARFVQTEKFIQSLVDVQVRAEVPLIP